MVSFFRKYAYTLAPAMLVIGFVQSYGDTNHVSSTDVQKSTSDDVTTIKANADVISHNSSTPGTNVVSEGNIEASSTDHSDSTMSTSLEIGGREWLAGTSDQVLFQKFFEEMKNKNYASAKEICAELENRAATSRDASKLAAVKELRSTLDLILPAD